MEDCCIYRGELESTTGYSHVRSRRVRSSGLHSISRGIVRRSLISGWKANTIHGSSLTSRTFQRSADGQILVETRINVCESASHLWGQRGEDLCSDMGSPATSSAPRSEYNACSLSKRPGPSVCPSIPVTTECTVDRQRALVILPRRFSTTVGTVPVSAR